MLRGRLNVQRDRHTNTAFKQDRCLLVWRSNLILGLKIFLSELLTNPSFRNLSEFCVRPGPGPKFVRTLHPTLKNFRNRTSARIKSVKIYKNFYSATPSSSGTSTRLMFFCPFHRTVFRLTTALHNGSFSAVNFSKRLYARNPIST